MRPERHIFFSAAAYNPLIINSLKPVPFTAIFYVEIERFFLTAIT